MKMQRVFLSHTSDMARFPEDRSFVQAALDAVGRAQLASVDMRYFAARDHRPADYCQRQVLACDIYVAIIGFRYGSLISGEGVSYTELEFMTASSAELPRLVFLLAEAACAPGLADVELGPVEGFRKRLRGAGLIVREFTSSDSLELEVFHALTDLTAPDDKVPAQHASKAHAALSRAYISALTEPIIPAGDMPVGLKMPTLEEGYIDHRIRVAEVTSSSDPGRESWWVTMPIHDSAYDFLLTNMTSSRTLTAPLVLLGQPGSGKSILTRILAARLSTAGFMPVRIELRLAADETDLQKLIELAIRRATGETAEWREITETADRVIPVVIFDGFDELLQATGVMQNDFLLRIQEFQEREARLGKPLAVIVTSRTAVTDRARFPHGATAIRLEAFDEGQIGAWLKIWNRTNQDSLAGRGIRPLPASVALSYGELAEQPLLLLMLALYDADANGLQHRSSVLSRTELYGRLLRDFAIREIRKQSPLLDEDDLEHAADAELLRLSVVAFAMFNRRSQWVPEADLDIDFSALLIDEWPHARGSTRSRAELTIAQLTVGRFFFIHEARATHGNRRLRTYEFLHATFGEFLVSRLVVHVLTGKLESRTRPALPAEHGIDTGMLHALLSFAALTDRTPIVAFLADLFDQLDRGQREAITDVLLQLHNWALFRQPESAYSHYEPLILPATVRHAAWSANLVILAVLSDGEITGSRLYSRESNPQLAWRSEALVWRSQLAGYGWEGMHETISFKRVWDGQRKDFLLSRNDGTVLPEPLDMSWVFNMPPDPEGRNDIFSSPSHNSLMTQRKINFASNMSEDIMAHDLAPLISSFPSTANVFVALSDGRVVSAVHALISALYAPYQEGSFGESVFPDLAHVAGRLMKASNVDQDAPFLRVALGVLISSVDHGIASPTSVELMARSMSDTSTEDADLTGLLARLNGAISHYRRTRIAAGGGS